MRLWVMISQVAQILQYSHDNKVLTPRMIEYKKYKPAKNSHPFRRDLD
jgi:hypothetical protein